MRPVLLSLLAATAAFAQVGPSRSFTLGVSSFGPTFTGKMEGVQDGQPLFVDLDADLGLAKDKAKVGLLLDYQGPRFGFMVQSGGTDYAGDKTLTRNITIDGTTYAALTRVTSHLKLKTVEGIWTIRFVPLSAFWVGLDLGVESWKLDVDATGTALSPVPGTATATTSVSAPIPQVGLSLGSHAPGGIVEVKGFYHYLGAKGAKYSRAGVDLRVFPIPHVGLRAFYETESFDVPKGSLQDDLMLNLDRKGAGFGLVVTF
ncbi:MAG TPA: hypothetical protein VJ623_04675 [Holophagaceae bacterium]|nr:hypothetical protein [Holophagaceae bacterium]